MEGALSCLPEFLSILLALKCELPDGRDMYFVTPATRRVPAIELVCGKFRGTKAGMRHRGLGQLDCQRASGSPLRKGLDVSEHGREEFEG